jgi:hypothetical protein
VYGESKDEVFVSEDGKFACVLDGHGGSGVARYLKVIQKSFSRKVIAVWKFEG